MGRVCQSIHRRDFVRTISVGAAAVTLFGRDALADVLGPRKARVALVRTSDRRQGVAAAMKLFAPRGIGGKRIVLKPNFNSAHPTPGSTHNDTLSAIVSELHARDARSIVVAESSGPPQTRGVMEQKGIFDLARQERFDLVNLEELPESGWVSFPAAGTHWPDGFALPRAVTDAEYIVSTCCLKTHAYGGVFTMSLKLSVGLTPKPIRRPMHRSPHMRRMIAELNTGYQPSLIVLDGIEAFTDGGPSEGERKAGNVILVGDDRIAIDAVGLAVLKAIGSNEAIMSRPVFGQEQIARAVELGLGVSRPEDIEIVTADAESRAFADRLRPLLVG